MGSQSRRLGFLGREDFDEIFLHCKSATPESSSMRKAWSCQELIMQMRVREGLRSCSSRSSQKLRGLRELFADFKVSVYKICEIKHIWIFFSPYKAGIITFTATLQSPLVRLLCYPTFDATCGTKTWHVPPKTPRPPPPPPESFVSVFFFSGNEL